MNKLNRAEISIFIHFVLQLICLSYSFFIEFPSKCIVLTFCSYVVCEIWSNSCRMCVKLRRVQIKNCMKFFFRLKCLFIDLTFLFCHRPHTTFTHTKTLTGEFAMPRLHQITKYYTQSWGIFSCVCCLPSDCLMNNVMQIKSCVYAKRNLLRFHSLSTWIIFKYI